MSRTLLKNAVIVTGSASFKGSLAIEDGRISGIWENPNPTFISEETIDLEGKILMAGGIDAHVHFREPGLTWKADISTVTMEVLEDKLSRAAGSSKANYGFHIGATNENADVINGYLKAGRGNEFAGINRGS